MRDVLPASGGKIELPTVAYPPVLPPEFRRNVGESKLGKLGTEYLPADHPKSGHVQPCNAVTALLGQVEINGGDILQGFGAAFDDPLFLTFEHLHGDLTRCRVIRRPESRIKRVRFRSASTAPNSAASFGEGVSPAFIQDELAGACGRFAVTAPWFCISCWLRIHCANIARKFRIARLEVVPVVGLEPTRSLEHKILNLARIPYFIDSVA